jgi:hypothetical protein
MSLLKSSSLLSRKKFFGLQTHDFRLQTSSKQPEKGAKIHKKFLIRCFFAAFRV